MDTAHNAEESSCCVPENHKNLSGRSQNGGQEPQNQLQKSTCSKDKNSLTQQFKNVVAIVDPPHMGFHPILSNKLFILCRHFSVLGLVDYSSNQSFENSSKFTEACVHFLQS
ncbi:hypothetical protein SLEP1_g19933 [Rubroshorea leprosula]|uniref:Uncharacterized protein n=1 Tax=Rubroshorea leprosula TaxID=152421 RepID=A0AAV5J6X2_9ROSI|nr:hypothetical protein SLEP1_g19933 [Rubroshorea leprosula]